MKHFKMKTVLYAGFTMGAVWLTTGIPNALAKTATTSARCDANLAEKLEYSRDAMARDYRRTKDFLTNNYVALLQMNDILKGLSDPSYQLSVEAKEGLRDIEPVLKDLAKAHILLPGCVDFDAQRLKSLPVDKKKKLPDLAP